MKTGPTNFASPVKNNADMFPKEELEAGTYEINSTVRKFWKNHSTEDSSDWYKEGYTTGSYCIDGTTGSELLYQLVGIVNTLAIKHLRKHNRPVDSNIKKLHSVLMTTTQLLLANSVEIINANEGALDKEEVTAFLHGFINAQYEKIRTQYVD